MALRGPRGLLGPCQQQQHSQQRQPIRSPSRLLKPGSSWQHSARRTVHCQAAASDQKSASEPMYLSDLIMFEVCVVGLLDQSISCPTCVHSIRVWAKKFVSVQGL
jgi:hypothetical protein